MWSPLLRTRPYCHPERKPLATHGHGSFLAKVDYCHPERKPLATHGHGSFLAKGHGPRDLERERGVWTSLLPRQLPYRFPSAIARALALIASSLNGRVQRFTVIKS